MDKNILIGKIVEYLDGKMDPGQEAEFKKILEQSGYDINELTDLEGIYKMLEDYHVPEPSEKMHNSFYSMLDDYKEGVQEQESLPDKIINWFSSFNNRKLIPQLVYSFILIILGWAVGFWLTPGSRYNQQMSSMSSEIHVMKEMMMLTMIDKPSASERIQAVNLTNDLDNVNDKIVNALLKTLNNDPNVNVRLITVEALYEFAGNPKVREGLIHSISLQESPLVQIALADVMVSLQEKKSVNQFMLLLGKKDLNDAARTKIEESMRVLI